MRLKTTKNRDNSTSSGKADIQPPANVLCMAFNGEVEKWGKNICSSLSTKEIRYIFYRSLGLHKVFHLTRFHSISHFCVNAFLRLKFKLEFRPKLGDLPNVFPPLIISFGSNISS